MNTIYTIQVYCTVYETCLFLFFLGLHLLLVIFRVGPRDHIEMLYITHVVHKVVASTNSFKNNSK